MARRPSIPRSTPRPQPGVVPSIASQSRKMCELIHTRRSKLRQLILPRRSVNVGSRLSPWSISRAALPIRSRLGSSARARSRPRLLFGPHVAGRASRWRSAHLVEKAVCELCAPPRPRRCSFPPARSVEGRVSRTHCRSTTVRNCTRDEGGPFEAGSQVQVSSHRELLSSYWPRA